MPLYTRSGDKGETWCFGIGEGGKPARVPKDHPLIEFLGALDEANSFVGLARSFLSGNGMEGELGEALRWLQRMLFNIGFSISSRKPLVGEDDVSRLEMLADKFYGEPLRRFVLPYGSPKVAALHVARSVLRRAERRLVAAAREEGVEIDETVFKAVNRASDFLFAAAIYLARLEGSLEEV